ncbi:neurotensin/neuromedin N isoform X1 [Electrophorus electricus]|uniref:neurotensin/neuromedin N isoform X1 n=1 Tax=Electrophorus electricus TaxID=8005 RepID=UPI0015D0C27A|nr:neurotensin/neuromedin N isoform X1 [Electrophorus electricus]
MQVQMTSVVILFLICNGRCTGAEHPALTERSHATDDQKGCARESLCSSYSSADGDRRTVAMEEETLARLLASEVKQSRHSAPLWQLPLLNMCRMLGSVTEPWQDRTDEEIQAGFEQRLDAVLTPTLEQLYDLQTLCKILHPREFQDGEEYLQVDEESENPLKRKSPYILKRQLHTNKVRRPYILKRTSFY